MSLLPRPFDDWHTYGGHGGIDYGVPLRTPVPASGPGVIDFDGYYSARGGFAKFVQYDNGERWGYYHFDRKHGLTVGDRVSLGTMFAFTGQLGLLSTGPHLHHEVWNGRSSIIRPPAYWDHVDRNHYVGEGSAAGGGGSRPLDTEGDEDTMATTLVTIGVPTTANVDGPQQYWLLNIDDYTCALIDNGEQLSFFRNLGIPEHTKQSPALLQGFNRIA